MALGMGVPKSFVAVRSEKRVPMEVGVRISGHAALPGTETTFTQNVSPRGARVLSTRPWKINDQMVICTMTGSFRSTARVAYCTITAESHFAVGLEFLEPNGRWVVDRAC
ncbi:MAG TPA: PilZ domain-containing protein [Candidatus Aquilonibacter sp.]|nr:PilZ domain-containing protein [Candidatus Aquilonibacter sp.]